MCCDIDQISSLDIFLTLGIDNEFFTFSCCFIFFTQVCKFDEIIFVCRTFVHIGSTLAVRLTHLLVEIHHSKSRSTKSQAHQLSAWAQAVKDLTVINEFLIEIRQISQPGLYLLVKLSKSM
jgi:hypothetical protein